MVLLDDFCFLVRRVGKHSLIFWNGFAMYLFTGAYEVPNQFWSTFLKCSPMFGLVAFIVFHRTASRLELFKTPYVNKILCGLMASTYGDALLNYECLELGMLLFGIGQAFYIAAFGWKPLKLWIGLLLYAIGGGVVLYLYSNLSLLFQLCLPIYTLLLTTMCWRAIALVFLKDNSKDIVRIVCAFAACLFVISDAILAVNKFSTPIRNASLWIMITYYLAQFGIAASTIDVEREKQSMPQHGRNSSRGGRGRWSRRRAR